jgi:hypothetical protein
MPRTPKPFDVNKSWMKLIIATLVLNLLILAAFLTSSPSKSPAATWETFYYQARFKLFPVTDKQQLATLHLNSAHISKSECVACHGDMLSSPITLHRLHLTSELLPGLVCHDCHQSIDLRPRGNTIVIKWVNEGFCKKCHSAFPGLQPGSPMRPENFKEDCTTCHTGQHTFRHEQPYLSQVIAPKECPGCHGGRILPWTPLHEGSDWLQTHGPEALRVGKESCFKCHGYGFTFCDQCHKLKPPSHLPADQWRVTHPARAAEDTRACFTCHQTSFCKKCHINHPANWLQDHPATVQASGDSRCMQCHSTSFCSACHASSATPASVTAPSRP